MSGGSYNYIYSRLLEECENRMYDAEMNDLINDLCEVLHDLEWWQSCDSSEEKYRATVEKFKAKWFKEDRTRLKGYIDETIEILKDLWRYEHSEYSEKDIRKALDIAIKALEKEPILDKLRAEIAEYGSIWVEYKITGRRDKDIEQLVSDVLSQAKKQVLEVIDKYKGESEVD